MNVKKALVNNNIKIIDNKIAKSDLAKALEVIANLTELIVGDTDISEEESSITINMQANFDLKESFKAKASELKSTEDLHELYENLDYVEEEFTKANVGLEIYNTIRGTLGSLEIDSVETDINYWASMLPKVEEKNFEEDLAKMIDNLGKLETEIEVKVYYSLDTSEIVKKAEEIVKKALKNLDV